MSEFYSEIEPTYSFEHATRWIIQQMATTEIHEKILHEKLDDDPSNVYISDELYLAQSRLEHLTSRLGHYAGDLDKIVAVEPAYRGDRWNKDLAL